MDYTETFRLKDGRECLLRAAREADAEAVCALFCRVVSQTDFLLSTPEDVPHTAEQEAEYLRAQFSDPRRVQLCAVLDGKIVGTASIHEVGWKEKVRHRADFGVSVDKEYWHLGIGRALTAACIACAKEAGYAQLELEAAAQNGRAIALYKSFGFQEYGCNPKGFRSRHSGWQELVLMRLEL